MKSRLLSLFAALSVVFSAIMFAPALVITANAAAAGTALAPATGPAGTSVLVTGTVTSGAAYQVRWDSATGPVMASGTAVLTAVTATVTIPAAPGNVAHSIFLVQTNGVGAGTSAAAAFTVTPNLTLSASNGVVGSSLTVTGTGFAAAEAAIPVQFDGVTKRTVTAGSTGSFTASFGIPAIPAGPYNVDAVAPTSGTQTAVFTVDPNLAISPVSGVVNTLVTATGTGFQPGDAINVDFGPVVSVPLLSFVPAPLPGTVPASGSWTATFRVPVGALAGDNSVVVSGTATPAVANTTRNFATPNITLTPATGPVGTVITVDGVGFQPNETGIHVTWASAVQTTTPATVTANAAGVWTATFVAPLAALSATPAIDAYGATTTLAQVPNQSFLVAAGIAVNPTSATVGTTVNVTGTGFVANEYPIAVNFNSGLVRNFVRANASGYWTTTFVVPATPASLTNAVDAVGPTTSQTTNLVTTPNLAISPTSGPSGTTVTTTGTGFQAGDTITVTWDLVAITTLPASPVADASGSWTATFAVPALSTAGAHGVDASGTGTLATDVPDKTYSVIGLTLDKTLGPVGTVVTANGTGFGTSESGIQITWDGASVRTGIAADTAGAWTATFIVPPAAGGAHIVDALGSSTTPTIVPNQTFSVTTAVAVSAAAARPGDSVTVSGTGFGSSETEIEITFDGLDVFLVGAADVNGSWNVNMLVPSSPRGTHQINAYGAVTAAGLAPNVPISVQQNLLVSPSSGPIGTTITASGTGFYAGETGIQVLFNGSAVKSAIIANATGTWSTTFAVPSISRGSYSIGASGVSTTITDVPTRSFTVNARASLDPSSGFAGKVVTIGGSGFAASSTITVTFEGATVTTTPSPLVATATGNVSGTFTVPSASPGSHVVAINDGTGPFNASFNVTSSVTSSVTSGTVGAQTSFGGQGFPPGTAVTFMFDSAPMTTAPAVTTDATGAFNAPLSIPDAARGTHTIKATAGTTTLSLNFEVSPSAAPATSSGTVDSSVAVTGKGFGANQALTVTIDGKAATTSPAQATASATGGFSLSVVLPKLSGGAHIIKVADSAASVQFNFSITPKVVVSTGTVKVGDKVSTSGTGMPAGATIAVSVDGTAATTNPSLVVAAADGTFSADVTVPPGAFGSHIINFSANNQSSQGTYSVTRAVSISTDNGNVGTAVTISGAGFTANSMITITYDTAPIGTTPNPVLSNAQGGFQALVTIPRSLHGQHVLTISDPTSSGPGVQAAFTMESTAPPLPTPLSPISGSRQGAFSGAVPTFSWSAVTDPSGVTYTLQVSKDSKFSTTVIQKTGLTATTHTAVGKEKLGSGVYYWRVKATDGASNESAWSQLFSLKVGILPAWMPLWMLIAMVVVGLAIILGVLYLLVLRKRTYV